MSHDLYTWRTRVPIPELGALAGDIIVLSPEDPEKPLTGAPHSVGSGPGLAAASAAPAHRTRTRTAHARVCGILEPATELQAVNQTGALLEVLAAPCGEALHPFCVIDHGRAHVGSVRPGCWHLEAWTDDGRTRSDEVTVAGGERHRVLFYGLPREARP